MRYVRSNLLVLYLDFAHEGRKYSGSNNLNNEGSCGSYIFFTERVFGR